MFLVGISLGTPALLTDPMWKALGPSDRRLDSICLRSWPYPSKVFPVCLHRSSYHRWCIIWERFIVWDGENIVSLEWAWVKPVVVFIFLGKLVWPSP